MDDFQRGDVVEVIETHRQVGKGAIGKVYGTSAPLAGLEFDSNGETRVIVEFKYIKKIPHSKLFPKRLKFVAPTK